MSDPVTFLHAGDLHFGAPLESPVLASSRQRRWLNASRERSLRRIVDRAIDFGVDFILWSGDLYERRWRSVQGAETVRRQLERLLQRDIDVLVARGNTDPSADGEDPFLPDGVTVFSDPAVREATVLRNDEPVARVLGASLAGTASGSPPDFAEFQPSDSSVFNLGLLHLRADPPGADFADTAEAIRESSPSDLDYWALGYGHVPRIVTGSPTIAVPGTPQGAGPAEPGPGGCLLVTAETDASPSVQFVPIGDVVWCRASVDLGRLDPAPGSPEQLLERMTEWARDLRSLPLSEIMNRFHDPELALADGASNPVEGYLVRWTVRGRGDLHRALSRQESVDRFLARSLNGAFQDEEPFVLAESVHLRTGRRLGAPLEELAENDELLSMLNDLLQELEGDAGVEEELLEVFGDVWDARTEPESLPSDRLPLTESTYRELLDHAASLVVDRILAEHEEHVD